MKQFKKIIPLILVVFTVFFTVIPAEAKTKKPYFIKPSKNSMLYVDDDITCFQLYQPKGFSKKQWNDYKILSAQSSNKKVATVSFCCAFFDFDGDGKEDAYIGDAHIKARKAGTTKITIKYIENGKKKTYKFNLRVFNYQSPVSEFKLGQKELSSYFGKYSKEDVKSGDGRNTYDLTKKIKYDEIASYPITESSLPVVSWKTQKGYAIKSIRFATNNSVNGIDGDISKKAITLTNGQQVKIKEERDEYYNQAIQIYYTIKGYKYLGYTTSKGYQIKTLYFNVDFEDEYDYN